jgi:hypothetical protein
MSIHVYQATFCHIPETLKVIITGVMISNLKYKILIFKPEEKGPLINYRCRWDFSIKWMLQNGLLACSLVCQFMADPVITAVITLGSTKIMAYSPIKQIVMSAFAEDSAQ